MDDPFDHQRFYQVNVFCSGQYRTNCERLLYRQECTAELQINVPELVERRSYQSNFDSQ